MHNSRKLLSLAITSIALIWALPASAVDPVCVGKNGKLLVTPASGNYCSCVATLTKKELRKFGIESAQVDECLLTTGSLATPALITIPTPTDVNPPVVPVPPPDGTVDGKGNNGLGNGSDPAPPGIGNAGNDGGNVPAGSVAVTTGSPGGSSTAPGQNK